MLYINTNVEGSHRIFYSFSLPVLQSFPYCRRLRCLWFVFCNTTILLCPFFHLLNFRTFRLESQSCKLIINIFQFEVYIALDALTIEERNSKKRTICCSLSANYSQQDWVSLIFGLSSKISFNWVRMRKGLEPNTIMKRVS